MLELILSQFHLPVECGMPQLPRWRECPISLAQFAPCQFAPCQFAPCQFAPCQYDLTMQSIGLKHLTVLCICTSEIFCTYTELGYQDTISLKHYGANMATKLAPALLDKELQTLTFSVSFIINHCMNYYFTVCHATPCPTAGLQGSHGAVTGQPVNRSVDRSYTWDIIYTTNKI